MDEYIVGNKKGRQKAAFFRSGLPALSPAPG
jgi:hypothetical protein